MKIFKRPIFWIYDLLTKNTLKWWKLFNRTQYWSYDMLRAFQLKQLRKVCKSHNIIINDWNDFYKLPLTTKEDLRKFKPKLNPKKKYTKHYSSGSTGEPLLTYGPKNLQFIKSAIFDRAWQWVGWNKRDWIIRLTAGKPQWKFYDWLRNVYPINYRTINDGDVHKIMKLKPFLIHGGSGSIREITTRAIKLGYKKNLKNIKLYLMSEDTKKHKKVLDNYYKAVHSGYGLSELCTVASECNNHNLHINMETAVVEVIKEEIIVTDLFNYVTPIIRYRTKDTGKLYDLDMKDNEIKQYCLCGNNMNILFDIVGRSVDYYDGPEIKKPLSWWVLSPISHKLSPYLKQWKVKVYIKKKEFRLYVVVNDYSRCKFITYGEILGELERFIKENTGLDLKVIERKRMSNKERMCLMEIIQ